MNISIELHGVVEVLRQMGATQETVDDAVTRGLEGAAARVVLEAQSLVSDAYPPKSMPGMPPHLRTGALKRSIRIDDVQPNEVTVAAGGPGSFAPYAGWLEYGTSKMEPRPFMEPAGRNIEPVARDYAVDAINKIGRKRLMNTALAGMRIDGIPNSFSGL